MPIARRLAVPLVALALVCAVASLAWAGETPPPPDAGGIMDAMLAGRWAWLTGFVVIAVTEPAKRALIALWPSVMATDVAGVVLAFIAAAATNVGLALIAGAAWDLDLVVAILRSAFLAIGGYTAIKRLLVSKVPKLAPVMKSLPQGVGVGQVIEPQP